MNQFANKDKIAGYQKKNNILSIISGFPGICFLISGQVFNHLAVSILGIILLSLGMIFYGKAKRRGILWFLLWLPILIGGLLYKTFN